MSRRIDLIRLAADVMDKGEDPFHISFLTEHDVTLDEAYDLSDALAEAARLYLHLLANPGELVTLRMAAAGETELAETFHDALRMQQVTESIRRLRDRRIQ